jgi:hypothetical protein
MPNDDIKDDVTEDQVQTDQAQAEDDQTDADAPSDDEEWTEEDMRLLSEEERAALFEGDDDGADAEGDDADAEQAPAAETAPAEAEETAEEATGTYATDIATLDAEIEALTAAKEAAFDAWEEGESSRDEYLAKLKEIDNQTRDLIAEKAVAESQERAVYDAFIKAAKGYFGEYPDLATQAHAEAYDRHVRSVTGNPAYQHMTHRQMLEAAHKLYAAEADVLGVDVPAPKGKAKPAPAPTPEAKADPAPARKTRPGDKAPVTLRNVPNAAPVSVSDGKYSSIAQRLENAGPEEYERIMGSLSVEDAEAFASMDV